MTLAVTDAAIDACGFRMFELHEIAVTMAMADHPSNGGLYEVLGNKRERMAQYGNAVTPPVTRLILERLFDVLGGGATFKDLFCGAGGSSIGATPMGAVELRDSRRDPLPTQTTTTRAGIVEVPS